MDYLWIDIEFSKSVSCVIPVKVLKVYNFIGFCINIQKLSIFPGGSDIFHNYHQRLDLLGRSIIVALEIKYGYSIIEGGILPIYSQKGLMIGDIKDVHGLHDVLVLFIM